MPKDAWAKAKQKDAVRRSKWDRRQNRKRKNRRIIHQQMQSDRARQNKILGNSGHTVHAGTAVQIRRPGTTEWIPYSMEKTITGPIVNKTADYTTVRFMDWLIRIARPKGF